MAVILARRRRMAFASDDLFSGTIEERARASSSFIAYCGRYSIPSHGEIVHRIGTSLYPNRSGTTQQRFFTLKANRLTLRTPPMPLAGGLRTGVLLWQRARGRFS